MAEDRALANAFADEDYRYAYAEDFLNAWVATQIVTLREQRGLNQTEFGQLIGTKQPGVSRLEDINHSTWKTETLKRIAKALGVRLKISFETFGTLLEEDRRFNREYLKRLAFDKDPAFRHSRRKQPSSETAMLSDQARELPGQSAQNTDTDTANYQYAQNRSLFVKENINQQSAA